LELEELQPIKCCKYVLKIDISQSFL